MDAAREQELRELHARMQRLNEGLDDLTSAARTRARRASMPVGGPSMMPGAGPHMSGSRSLDPYADTSPHQQQFPHMSNIPAASADMRAQYMPVTPGYQSSAGIPPDIYADMERMAQEGRQARAQPSMQPNLQQQMPASPFNGHAFANTQRPSSPFAQSFSAMPGSSVPHQSARPMTPGVGGGMFSSPASPGLAQFQQATPFSGMSPQMSPQMPFQHSHTQQPMRPAFAMSGSPSPGIDPFGRSSFAFPSPFGPGPGPQSHFHGSPMAPGVVPGMHGMQTPGMQHHQYGMPMQSDGFGHMHGHGTPQPMHGMHGPHQHGFARSPSPFGAF